MNIERSSELFCGFVFAIFATLAAFSFAAWVVMSFESHFWLSSFVVGFCLFAVIQGLRQQALWKKRAQMRARYGWSARFHKSYQDL